MRRSEWLLKSGIWGIFDNFSVSSSRLLVRLQVYSICSVCRRHGEIFPETRVSIENCWRASLAASHKCGSSVRFLGFFFAVSKVLV